MSGRTDGMPHAVLLDALGTLIELEPPAPLLRDELRRRYGLALSEAECARAIAAEIRYYRAHLDEGRDHESLAALRRRCAAALHEALPPAARDATGELGTLTDALLASLRFRPYPDVLPALAGWRGRGRRLVVVSNWDVSLHQVLERVGLAPSLDGVLTSAEAGARKPAPWIFERALEVAGVGPSDAIHVGDSIDEDVAGALAAGIEAVLLRRGQAGPSAAQVRTIASLAELLD